MTAPLTPDGLEAALRAVGAERYHNLHPFHRLLHDGRLTRGQVAAWALNRSHYQAMIPVKDATLLARLPTPELRRIWRQRIVDHDGESVGDGGFARWQKLTASFGFSDADVEAGVGVLPATQFAVQAYVRFVAERSLLEAIASSLTEMFSPAIIAERVSGMLANYPFVTPETLAYFAKRPAQASRDVDFALGYVRAHAVTTAQQQAAIAALRFKCDVLWAQLDALHFAYVEPALPPPGAWRPEKR